jgi:hypothetical protein
MTGRERPVGHGMANNAAHTESDGGRSPSAADAYKQA